MNELRPNTHRDIERILHNYSGGQFDRIATAYLLIKLRYPKKDGIFWDIASYVAHDDRSFGVSYDNASTSLSNLLKLMEPGRPRGGLGLITRGAFLITQEEMYEETRSRLTALGFSPDFERYEFLFMRSVIENLSGTQLKLRKKDTDKIVSFDVSEPIEDDNGRTTVYARVKPTSNAHRANDRSGQGPQFVTVGQASFGFPILQAAPDGVEASYDPYVWT